MPLDDLGFTKTPGGDATSRGNTVRALGIEAVPPRLVRRHKRQMLKAFRNDPLNSFIARQYAAWHWAWVEVDVFPSLRAAINAAMTFSISESTPAISAPPAAILDVADEVDLRLEASNIRYQVEYFYNDPILNVLYRDKTGEQHVDCLGIWDNGKIVRVATRISAKQPGFFLQLFHLA